MKVTCEERGPAAVAWVKGSKHKLYEDRYRLLPRAVPLVAKQNRGEIFAVFDGIGSAAKGMQAAQFMANALTGFYNEPFAHLASWDGIKELLMQANLTINKWGVIPGSGVPLGGCAGTVVWLFEEALHVFHAGDTAGVFIRDGRSLQLTRAHQMENGAIFRYFGLGPYLELDTDRYTVQDGDRVLLLSDGVTKVLHPLEAANSIREIYIASEAVGMIAQRSVSLGSTDDITVVLVEVEEQDD